MGGAGGGSPTVNGEALHDDDQIHFLVTGWVHQRPGLRYGPDPTAGLDRTGSGPQSRASRTRLKGVSTALRK